MSKIRVLTASAGLLVALAAPKLASAQSHVTCGPIGDGPHQTITVLIQNGQIVAPNDSEVRRQDCVCWKGGNIENEMKISFPVASPFADGGPAEFVDEAEPWRVCAFATNLGDFYYDVNLDKIGGPDPWLDVTP